MPHVLPREKVLSKPRQLSEEVPFSKGISLTLVIAVLPTLGAAEAAMLRIKATWKTGGVFVNQPHLRYCEP